MESVLETAGAEAGVERYVAVVPTGASRASMAKTMSRGVEGDHRLFSSALSTLLEQIYPHIWSRTLRQREVHGKAKAFLEVIKRSGVGSAWVGSSAWLWPG